MKLTSKETYKVIRAALRLKKFTQYQISKGEKVTFSLVNRIVNWLVSRGYAAKGKEGYAIVAPVAILAVFPLYRKMKPYATFDVNLSKEAAIKMLKGKGVFCLTSALSFYDDYYRDDAIHVYLEDKKIIDELKDMKSGYCHIELYEEDLNKDDAEKITGQNVTNKIRTMVDLFCANKAYAAERLIKKEWI